MKIERDEVEFLAGVRGSETLGSPIAVVVRNRDHKRRKSRAHGSAHRRRRSADQSATRSRRLCGRAEVPAARSAQRAGARQRPRDGDARLPGAICAQFLDGARASRRAATFHRIGAVDAPRAGRVDQSDVEASDVRCPHPARRGGMIAAIDAAKAAGDTLGGQFIDPRHGRAGRCRQQPSARISARRYLGRRADGDADRQSGRSRLRCGRRGEARLGGARRVRVSTAANVVRRSNRAGGIEGGMSNGQPI